MVEFYIYSTKPVEKVLKFGRCSIVSHPRFHYEYDLKIVLASFFIFPVNHKNSSNAGYLVAASGII